MRNDRHSRKDHQSDDDVYKHLQKCFLRKGRGRPYDRPQVSELTNRLLLQLYFLKEEDNSSFKQLKEWLERLVPHMDLVTESRIYQRVQFILNTCNCSTPDVAVKFLTESYCFHDLSDSLSAFGLKRFHLQGAVPYTLSPCIDVSNAIVIDLEKLRAQERESQLFVYKWLKRLSLPCGPLTNTQMKRRVDKCRGTYTKLCKGKNRSDVCLKKFNDFLKVPFINEQADVSLPAIPTCFVCTNLIDVNKDLKSTNDILQSNNTELASKLLLQEDIDIDLSCDLKQCEKEKKHVDAIETKLNVEQNKNVHLQNENVHLQNENVHLQNKNVHLQNELDVVKKSKLYLDNHSQKRRLQNEIVEKESLKKENENLMKEVESKDAKLELLTESLCSVKKKLKFEQSLKSEYKVASDKKIQN